VTTASEDPSYVDAVSSSSSSSSSSPVTQPVESRGIQEGTKPSAGSERKPKISSKIKQSSKTRRRQQNRRREREARQVVIEYLDAIPPKQPQPLVQNGRKVRRIHITEDEAEFDVETEGTQQPVMRDIQTIHISSFSQAIECVLPEAFTKLVTEYLFPLGEVHSLAMIPLHSETFKNNRSEFNCWSLHAMAYMATISYARTKPMRCFYNFTCCISILHMALNEINKPIPRGNHNTLFRHHTKHFLRRVLMLAQVHHTSFLYVGAKPDVMALSPLLREDSKMSEPALRATNLELNMLDDPSLDASQAMIDQASATSTTYSEDILQFQRDQFVLMESAAYRYRDGHRYRTMEYYLHLLTQPTWAFFHPLLFEEKGLFHTSEAIATSSADQLAERTNQMRVIMHELENLVFDHVRNIQSICTDKTEMQILQILLINIILSDQYLEWLNTEAWNLILEEYASNHKVLNGVCCKAEDRSTKSCLGPWSFTLGGIDAPPTAKWCRVCLDIFFAGEKQTEADASKRKRKRALRRKKWTELLDDHAKGNMKGTGCIREWAVDRIAISRKMVFAYAEFMTRFTAIHSILV
jgi:hypothetical protein